MGVKDSSASGTIMTPGPRCVCAPGATHTQLNEGLLTTLLDEVVLERVAVLIFVALVLFLNQFWYSFYLLWSYKYLFLAVLVVVMLVHVVVLIPRRGRQTGSKRSSWSFTLQPLWGFKLLNIH